MEHLQLPGLEGDLVRVEAALRAAVQSDDPYLSEIAVHLVRAGGKRIRPLLVLASALAAGGQVDEAVISGSVSVELVHLGSLYHDDVMDEAETRRGTESVNHRWGNLTAILTGDFLLARASEIAASLGTEVAALLARTIGNLCQGEVAQLEHAFNPGRPEPAYLRAIAGKTAALLATSARIGGIVSGASPEFIEALTGFGQAFGMTFQIWDDIRDLVATDDQLGKPAGHDMVEGTYTLPVIRALADPSTGSELRSLLGGPLDDVNRDRARSLVLSSGGVEESVTEARRWAETASEHLEVLRRGGAPSGPVDALAGVGRALVDGLARQ